MPRRSKHTGLSFIFSLLVNCAILFVLVGGAAGMIYKNHQQAKESQQQTPKIVHAVAVNQSQVAQEIQAIKSRRQAQKQAQINWRNKMQQQAKQAQQKEHQASQHFQTLQTQEKSWMQKTSAEKQKAQTELQRLQKMQQQMQQKLQNLETQRKDLLKQNTVVQSQLQQTEKELQAQVSQAEKARLEAKLTAEKQKQQSLQQMRINNQVARFKALIESAIERQWLIPEGISKNASCELSITLDRFGRVQSVNIVRSSGSVILDRSAVTAVLKASPLPVPQMPSLFKEFQTLQLTVKPQGVITQ